MLQQLDYLDFIDIYHERIKAFHVKDAEFNPTGRQGVYSRLSSPGSTAPAASARSATGRSISAASSPSWRSTTIRRWAVLEWECCLKHPEDGAREGAEFISQHIIRVTEKAFDDFAGGGGRPEADQDARSGSLRREEAMAIEGRSDAKRGGRIRLGMVGGGEGAFIGAVHRIASRIDDQYELVAGALSSTPEKARAPARRSASPPTASTPTTRAMAKAEAKRPDGIEAVSIVTPNHMHAGPAIAFLKAGIHVICDKPLTATLAEAKKLKAAVEKSGRIFALTHNYTGYPMVRQAREMVAAGELGELRLVQVEYPQDWLTGPTEKTGHKQADWRTDPKRSGAGGALGDIGTHAYNLADSSPGSSSRELCRRPHHVRRRARSSTTTSRSCCATPTARAGHAVGEPGRARQRERPACCASTATKGGLDWRQENPNQLFWSPVRQADRRSSPAAARARATRRRA